MGKRILSLLLAIVMVVGMVPSTAFDVFAASMATPEVGSKVINAYNETVTFDGQLTEGKWVTAGNLTDVPKFGAVYSAGKLYLGFAGVVDMTDFTISLNGKQIALSGEGEAVNIKYGTNTTEIEIDFAAAELELTAYDQFVPLVITKGANTWNGAVCFGSFDWMRFDNLKPTYNKGTNNSAINGGSNTDGVYNFYVNKDGKEAAGVTNVRVFAAPGGNTIAMSEGTSVLEFDFQVDKMPQYDYTANLSGGANFFPGFNMGVIHTTVGSAYSVVISRLAGYEAGYEGLYLLVSKNSNQSPAVCDVFKLDKALGERFHLRFEFTADNTDGKGDLVVYCDDVKLGKTTDIATNTGYGNTANINMNAWVQGANNVALGEVNFTISNVFYGESKVGSVLDDLTIAQFLGNNSSADNVLTALNLSKTVTHSALGSLSVTWKSSNNAVVNADTGTVTPGDEAQTVTLTAELTKDPTISKNFTITVPAAGLMNAEFTTETMKVDGHLHELSWNTAKWYSFGATTSKAAMLVNDGVAYLAIQNAGSQTLTVKIGEHEVTVAADGTVSGVTGGVTAAVANDTIEVKLDLKTLNSQIMNYGQKIGIQITLGENALAETKFAASQTVWGQHYPVGAEGTLVANSSGSYDGTTLNMYKPANKDMVEGSDVAAVLVGNNQNTAASKLDFSKDMTFVQTIKFTEMSVCNGSNRGNEVTANGYNLYLIDGDNDKGVSAVIYRPAAEETLKMYIYRVVNGTHAQSDVIDTGKMLNESFTLELRYNAQANTIAVFIDGAYKTTADNVLHTFDPNKWDQFGHKFTCKPAPEDGNKLNMTVTGMKLTVFTSADIPALKTELSADKVLEGYQLDALSGGAELPATFNTEYLGALPLTWVSGLVESNAIKENNELQPVTDTLTLKVGGTEMFTTNITVQPNLANIVTKDAVLGQGTITVTTEQLNLPATFDAGLETPVTLTWKSSNTAVIANNGTIVAPGVAELSIYANGNASALWSVKVIVPTAWGKTAMNAYLVEDLTKVTAAGWVVADSYCAEIDGDADRIFTAWQGDQLYLGIEGAAGKTVSVKLGSAEAKTYTLNDKGEVIIDLSDFDIDLQNYNEQYDFQVTLDDTALLEESTKLTFSGMAPKLLSTSYNFATNNQEVKYTVLNDGQMSRVDGDLIVTQTLKINKLENADGRYDQGKFHGYYIVLNDYDSSISKNHKVWIIIWNNNGELYIQGYNRDGYQAAAPLGVEFGETFTLDCVWTKEGSMNFYVNGNFVSGWNTPARFATSEEATHDALILYSYAICDVETSNTSLTVVRHTDIKNEMTIADICGDLDFMPGEELPSTYMTNVGEVELVWSGDAVGENGKIAANGTLAVLTRTLTVKAKINGAETEVDSESVNVLSNALEDKATVLGETVREVTADMTKLPLPTTITIGDQTANLTWKSSNTNVVEDDLTIKAAGAVTMTLMSGEKALWSVDVIVPSAWGKTAMNAYLVEDLSKITVSSWVTPETYKSVVGGKANCIFMAWKADQLYLGIEGAAGKTVSVKLGSAEAKTYTLNDKGEMIIDLSDFDIDLQNYNEQYDFQVTLGDTALLAANTKLTFSGIGIKNHIPTGNVNADENGKLHFVQGSAALLENKLGDSGIVRAKGDIRFSQTLKINSLTADGSYNSKHSVFNGFNIIPTDDTVVNNKAQREFFVIYVDNNKLFMKLRDQSEENGRIVDLGVDFGEEFKLDLVWEKGSGKGDKVRIYVNDNLIATWTTNCANGDDLRTKQTVRFACPQACDIEVSNISVTSVRHTSVTEEIELSEIIDEAELQNLSVETIALPQSYQHDYLGNVVLVWKSDKPTVISDAGVVTRQESTETVKLTVYVGEEKDENKLDEVTATVLNKNINIDNLPAWEDIANNNNIYGVVDALNLLATDGNGNALTWSVTDTEGNAVTGVIDPATGAVTRGEADRTVILTVSYALESSACKSFTVTVAGTKADICFTGEQLTVDGKLQELVWDQAVWTAVGKNSEMAILIREGIAYMAVKNAGAITVKWSDNSWFVDSDGKVTGTTAVTAEVTDGTLEMKVDLEALGQKILNYGKAYTVSVTMDAVTVERTFTVQQKSYGVVHTVPTESALIASGRTTRAGATIKMGSTKTNKSYDAENCAYFIQNSEIAGICDATVDMLLEQTLQINAMPYDATYTGTYRYAVASKNIDQESGAAPNNGQGYTIMLQLPNGSQWDISSCLIYRDAEGNLYIRAAKSNTEYTNGVALGKKLGDQFKLGLRYCTNGSVLVYVDGKQVADLGVIRYTRGKVYNTPTLMLKYLDYSTYTATSEEGYNAEIVISDMQMMHLGKTADLPALGEELSAAVLMPGVDFENLESKVIVPTEAKSKYLGMLPLSASWSNATVDAQGKVHHPETGAATVTLTMSVVGGDQLWTQEAAAQAKAPVLEANATLATVTLDGQLSEALWAVPTELAKQTGNGVSGYAYAAWGNGKLYIAVTHQGANKLQLNLAGKSWTLDLAANITTDDGIVTGVTANGITELEIDLLAAGIEPAAYGAETALTLKLIGAEEGNTAALANGEAKLIFTGKETVRPDHSADTSKNITEKTVDTVTFKRDADTGRQYVFLRDKCVDNTNGFYFEQTLTVKSMTDANGAWNNVSDASGYTFWLVGPETQVSGKYGGQGSLAVLFAEGDALKLKVRSLGTAGDITVDLGKTIGQQFHLGYLWNSDGSVTVFADGEQLARVPSATLRINSLGTALVVLNGNGFAGEVLVEDAAFTTLMHTEAPELTTEALLEAAGVEDVNNIQENLPVVYHTGHFAFNVNWNSSNENIISNQGVVVRDKYDYMTVTLNPIVGGEACGEVEVQVRPMTTEAEALATIVTPEAIFGGTVILANTQSLTLPGTYENEALEDGMVTLTWETSNEAIITAEGAILSAGEAYLTAYANDMEEALWTVKVIVPKQITEIKATVAEAGIVVDGIGNDVAWAMPYLVASVPTKEGTVRILQAAWQGKNLYLLVDCGNAPNLAVKVGEKSKLITLTDSDTCKIVDGVAEVMLSLSDDFGISPENYNETYDFILRIGDLNVIDGGKLTLSGYITKDIDLNKPDGDLFDKTLAYQITDGKLTINTSSSKRAYWGVREMPIDRKQNMLLEQTLTVRGMESSGEFKWDEEKFYSYFSTSGYAFNLSETTDAGQEGNIAMGILYNDPVKGLVLRIPTNETDSYTDIVLNKQVNGESFKLGFLWAKDDSVAVYVDDVYMGEAEKVSFTYVYGGNQALMLNNTCVADMDIEDVTLTTLYYEDIRDEITLDKIFGNRDLSNVTDNLPLNEKYHSDNLNADIALTWTSSNKDVITTKGVVKQHDTRNQSVDLSVKAGDDTKELWKETVVVPSRYKTLNALLSESAITADNKLSESVWLNWMKIGDAGYIAAAWQGTDLYIAVSASESLAKLVLNINGVRFEKRMTGKVAEYKIPMSSFDYVLKDYNCWVNLTASLMIGDKTSYLDAEVLNFSGDVASAQTLGGYTKSTGPFTLNKNEISYNGKEPGTTDYVYKANNNLDHTNTIVLSNEFRFDALPTRATGNGVGGAKHDGFYFYFGDQNPETGNGMAVCSSIYNENGRLKLYVGNGKSGEKVADRIIDLNKGLGDTFRLTYFWYPNNDVAIFVDNTYATTVKDGGFAASSLGVDVISYRYYSADVSNNAVKFSIMNQNKISTKYETVLDEVTLNAIFGRVDLAHLQEDLTLNDTFQSKYFGDINLAWETDNANVITAEGKITALEEESQSATLTVTATNALGTKKVLKVKVTVDPKNATKQPAPAVLHTAFGKDIAVDNVLNSNETWLLNGWILNNDKKPAGYFGFQWNEDALYMAVSDAETDTVKVTVGEATFDLTVNGSVAEKRINWTDVGLEAPIAYNTKLAVKVQIGESVYEGELLLTSTDWWVAQNAYNPMPVLDNSVKSTKSGTSDTPNDNQGAMQIENGWRLFDLYEEGSTNPAGIRTYVLFMNTDPYLNFADRSEATQIEFDFHATKLPVWKWDEGAANDMGRAFANYGVTFSLSDAADGNKYSNVAVFGIVNTEDGLMLVINRGPGDYEALPLNKQVGEEFRIGMTWELDASMKVYIDGEPFTTITGISKWVASVGDTSFVVNMIRNKVKPTSSADDMEVYLTNMAFGRTHGSENLVRYLDYEDLLNDNESQNAVKTNLSLPAQTTNHQLSKQYTINWTSSDPKIIAADGTVTRPTDKAKTVILTAEVDGYTKEFSFIVLANKTAAGTVLVAQKDTDPFHGEAKAFPQEILTFDVTNNSVVWHNSEKTDINLVTLHDVDAYSKLNRESLRLFVSADNKTYTEIRDYKLHHDGTEWYLYDFTTNAEYIKVHYTHRDTRDADFINMPGDIITAEWNESLVIPDSAAVIAVPGTTVQDEAVAITLPEDITADGLRVALGDKLLFHYVDRDGTVYVRIPNKDTGFLKLWNAEDIELADKENVYEVTYGTRETLPTGGRWILGLKAGQTFPKAAALEKDTLYHMTGKTVHKSTDGGYTWEKVGTVAYNKALSSGGWGIDSKTGRLFHEFYTSDTSFNGSDITKSYCETFVFYSDDGGKTWRKAKGLGQIEGDVYSNYVLSYTDITELAGNDGKDSNVDFVFPMGAQYNNNGAFCSRIAYTRDGGLSWQYSESLITYGNETAFEGGVSEASILEREDGTLVFYARCQSADVDNFTVSYSLDHGVTWLTPGETSSVYTTNTQALMMTYDFGGFDGNRTTGTPMFMWGGNNVLGGSSYYRMPLNFAISTNEMDTFRYIQNIFSETFMDTFSFEADHYITNPSIQQINGHDMLLSFSRLNQHDSIYMVVNDFTDWFLRTKGAYDSFEHGTAAYEGWSVHRGGISVTSAKKSSGNLAMLVDPNTQVGRTVPYLQDGKLSIDLYVDANSNYTLELQPAFSSIKMKCAVISATVQGTTMTLQDGTSLTLQEGWNTVAFNLKLTENQASVAVNGGEAKTIAVNTQFNGMNKHDLGNYITYVTILSTSEVYVDELLVISNREVVLAATEEDKDAAEAVIEQIKALAQNPTEEAIANAKTAFNALTQEGKDLVNRRVRNGDATLANQPDALINYYDLLMQAEAVLDGGVSLKDINANGSVASGVTGITGDAVSSAAKNEQTTESLNDAAQTLIEIPEYTEVFQAAKNALGSEYDPSKLVEIEVRPALNMHVQEADATGMKVEINATYAQYAIQGNTVEKIPGTDGVLNTTGHAIIIKLPLPAGFVSSVDDKVLINHYDDEGNLKGTHEGTVSGNATDGFFVTFENSLGFSEFHLNNVTGVEEVEDLINAIGTVTVSKEAQIAAARAAYEALPDERKAFVTNLEALEAAEAALAGLKEAHISYATLSLKDYVRINFYMLLDETVAADEDAYMRFAQDKEGAVPVQVTDRRVVTSGGKTYYVYSYSVAAKEMGDEITAQFFYGNGKSTKQYTYSVKQYVEDVLASDDYETYTAELRTLLRDMLQYGAEAQKLFGYKTNELADAGVANIAPSELDSVTADTLKQYQPVTDLSALTNKGIALEGSLLLKDATVLRFSVLNASSLDQSKLTIKINGVAAEIKEDATGNRFYVDIPGIPAKNLDTQYAVTVIYDGVEGTMTYSPMSYCYQMVDNEQAGDLVKSLYLYHIAAKTYF